MTCTNMTYAAEGGAEDYEEMWNFITMVWDMTDSNWDKEPSNRMFMKLFRYIAGVNKIYEEIDMTTPVLVTLQKIDNKMMFQRMCFYIPSKFQENPPQPLEMGVSIEKFKEMTVYVQKFGG